MSLATGRGRKTTSRPGASRGSGRLAGMARGAAGLARGRGRGRFPRRRSRGITSRELRGFRKVTRLLRSVGMRPKGLGGTRRARK